MAIRKKNKPNPKPAPGFKWISQGSGGGFGGPTGGGLTPGVISPPAGFTWTPPITVSRQADRSITTSYNFASKKPAYTATYYAGATATDNTGDGLTWATRKRSLKAAIVAGKAAVGTSGCFRLVVDTSAPFYFTDVVSSVQSSFAGETINCSIVIESYDGGTIKSVHDVTIAGSWTATTDPNIWVKTYTTEAVAPAVLDQSKTDEDGDWQFLARCNVTAGSTDATHIAAINTRFTEVVGGVTLGSMGVSSLDTTNKKIYVRLFDNRTPDANVRTMSSAGGGNLVFQSADGATITGWGEKIRLYGISGIRHVGSSVRNMIGYFDDVRSMGSTGSGFGFGGGPSTIITSNCISKHHGQDGFNWNCLTGQPCRFIEINNKSRWTGWGSEVDGSNNGTTSHSDCTGVRINGDYKNNSNRTIHDIQNSKTWNLKCVVGAGRLSGAEYSAGVASGLLTLANTSEVWLDDCTISGQDYQIQASDGGKVYTANMTTTGYVNQVTSNLGTSSINTYEST